MDALRFAMAPWSEMLATFTRPGWNGPLYFLLLRGWIALTGTSEYGMRFFSLFFGVLCVPLSYVLGRRMFDYRTGLLAALLMSLSPYQTWYGQEVKMYTLVPALALLALYGLRCAVAGRGWHWWVVQVVATSMAFYSHILAALLVPVQMSLYFIWWPQARRQWIGGLISLACLTLPYLPLASWQAPQVFQVRETGFYPYTLGAMVEVLLNGWSTGLLGWGWPWGTLVMVALAVWGLASPFLRPLLATPSGPARAGERLALVCWLMLPLLAVWFISLWQPLFTDRYLVWTAPAFYMLVSLGLTTLWRFHFKGWGRLAVILFTGILLVVSGVNLWQQATMPIKSDFRAAAAYVADRYVTGDLILFQIPYGRYTFDYYFPEDEYPWAEGLYTNHRDPGGAYLMGEREAAYRMQEMTAGYSEVWLIATETTMWDERGLVKAWLEANAERVDEAHFARVDVYRYVIRKT
ncbi:MAG: hypothetical protein DRI48_09820 [Chloroflexi bacterium]|nr:MAG: hypothetical protein DRI48_09820 [Chloroflexota bacterium]